MVLVSFLGADVEGLASDYLDLPFLDREKHYLLFISSLTPFPILSKVITEGLDP